MAEIVVDYIQIIEYIAKQLQVVFEALSQSSDETVAKQIAEIKSIEVTDEQSFIKKEKDNLLRNGSIYIAVRFGSGSINYGSSLTPISLYCIGTANKVKPVQLLLSVFASEWTTKNLGQGLESESRDMLQVWNTPEVTMNFNETYSEFRNLYRLTGNIVAGKSAVRVGTLKYYYMKNGTKVFDFINVMSFRDGYRASMDSQPFGDTHGFVKSEVNFSTYTFSVSTYLLDNQFSADLLAMRGYRNRNGGTHSSTFAPNDYMEIEIEFTNGFSNIPKVKTVEGQEVVDWMLDNNDELKGDYFFSYFKVVDSQIGQEIAGIPTIVITFTR